MKKVLVITLVLVMAFASSAMAAVNFSGKFTATAEQKNFKVFQEGYALTPGFEFTISGKADDKSTVTEAVEVEVAVLDEDGEETGETITEIQAVDTEVTNWDLTAALTLDNNTFKVGKYKLTLNDEWFTGYVWGNEQELTDKGTYFDMIKAGKASAAGKMRARLVAHVMGYADVTFDFAAPDNMRVFAEGEFEGFDIGLAYARTNWTDEDKVANAVVAQVGYDVPAGDLSVRLEGAVGVKLGEDLGLGFGLSADSDLTEQLNVNASVTHANEKWAGDALTAKNTVLKAGAAYTEQEFKVSGDVSYTIKPDPEVNTNTIGVTALYRMSETLDYDNLFKSDKWYTNDDLAVKAFASLTDVKLGEVGAEAVYPVLADMVWARAYGNYGSYTYKDEEDAEKEKTEKGFKAGAEVYVQATPKLVVRPLVAFEQIGKVFTIQATAKYKIGLSDTTLDFTAKKVTAEDILKTKNQSLLQAKVTIPF